MKNIQLHIPVDKTSINGIKFIQNTLGLFNGVACKLTLEGEPFWNRSLDLPGSNRSPDHLVLLQVSEVTSVKQELAQLLTLPFPVLSGGGVSSRISERYTNIRQSSLTLLLYPKQVKPYNARTSATGWIQALSMSIHFWNVGLPSYYLGKCRQWCDSSREDRTHQTSLRCINAKEAE